MRDSAGEPIDQESVSFSVTIKNGAVTEFTESHSVTSSKYGVCQFVIGQGEGTGSLANVSWNSQNITVQIDASVNGTALNIGSIKFEHVPYAFYALEAGKVEGVDFKNLNPQEGDYLAYEQGEWKALAGSSLIITEQDTARWNGKLDSLQFKNSLAAKITAKDTTRWGKTGLEITDIDTAKWNAKLDTATIAGRITKEDTARWGKTVLEITDVDTARWNAKLDTASLAGRITKLDTANWNGKQEDLFRWNAANGTFEGYDGTDWVELGGTSAESSPIGSVIAWPVESTIPEGWLLCDGSSFDALSYQDLYKALGNVSMVPDYRGYFLRGFDPSGTVDADRAGADFGVVQGDNTKVHSHTITSLAGTTNTIAPHSHTVDPPNTQTDLKGSHDHGTNSFTYSGFYILSPNGGVTSRGYQSNVTPGAEQKTDLDGNHTHSVDIPLFNSGLAGGHDHTVSSSGSTDSEGGTETRPKNVAVHYIIKAKHVFISGDGSSNFVEADPVFSSSVAKTITGVDVAKWNAIPAFTAADKDNWNAKLDTASLAGRITEADTTRWGKQAPQVWDTTTTGDRYTMKNVGIGTDDPLIGLHLHSEDYQDVATAGSTPSGMLRMDTDGGEVALDMGVASNTYRGAWLQSHSKSDQSVNYELLLNPMGGNVGVGTSNPKGLLHLSAAGAPLIRIDDEDDDRFGVMRVDNSVFDIWSSGGSSLSGEIRFLTGSGSGSERMRITGDGNVGIGITNPSAKLHIEDGLMRISSTKNSAGLRLNSGISTSDYGFLTLYDNTSTAQTFISGSVTNPSWIMGNVGIGTNDPKYPLDVNGIIRASTLYWGNGGNLAFRTATSGNDRSYMVLLNSSTSYALFCGNDGNFRMGKTSNISVNGGTDGGTIVGTQTSDRRLKTNITSLSNGISDVQSLRPVSFYYKTDTTQKRIGFIAQEAQLVIPEVVYNTGNREIYGVEEEDVLAMHYADITAVLVKATQEQQVIIDSQAVMIDSLLSLDKIRKTEINDVKTSTSQINESQEQKLSKQEAEIELLKSELAEIRRYLELQAKN